MCREGNSTAAAFLTHVGEVKEDLEERREFCWREMLRKMEERNILCSESEVEKIKPHIDGRLTIKYAVLDTGSLLLLPLRGTSTFTITNYFLF